MSSVQAFLGQTPLNTFRRRAYSRRTRRMSPRRMFPTRPSFLGQSDRYGPGMESPGGLAAMQEVARDLAAFTATQIAPNMQAVETSNAVMRLKQAIATSKAAGGYDEATRMFLYGLRAVRSHMTSVLNSGQMTDAMTQRVVDQLAATGLYLDLMAQAFPEGIPEAAATEAESLIKEINELVEPLQARRAAQYKETRIRAGEAEKALAARQVWQQQVQMQPDTNESVPGGGPAGSPDVPGPAPVDSVPGGGVPEPVIEKTALQKYGPVAALAAGGLAAWLALR